MAMMGSCRFIDCHKGTTLVGDVDNSGAYADVGAEGACEISAPSSLFCCEPRAPLKNQAY